MALAGPKEHLFRLMLEANALSFGSFTLKSGRISPYFFNSARFENGRLLAGLAGHYADLIAARVPNVSLVFGPAYKGIPLCVATAVALSANLGRPIGYLFNRKEVKTHGDKGMFVGQAPVPEDRIVMVDDVITDGGTKLEAVQLLRGAFTAPIELLVIAFDRMEQGLAGQDAIAEFQRATNVPVAALFTLDDLEAALATGNTSSTGSAGNGAFGKAGGTAEDAARLKEYRRQYGLPRVVR